MNPHKNSKTKERILKKIKDKKGEEYLVFLEETKKGNSKVTTINIKNKEGENISTASLVETEKNGKKEARITNVETKESYRKRGFADTALGFIEQEAFIKGHKKIGLISVNERSNRMYSKREYELIKGAMDRASEFRKKITPKNFIDRTKVRKLKR